MHACVHRQRETERDSTEDMSMIETNRRKASGLHINAQVCTAQAHKHTEEEEERKDGRDTPRDDEISGSMLRLLDSTSCWTAALWHSLT